VRAPEQLVLVANTALPSQRAQAVQVVHMASAFARAGVPTALCHARRRGMGFDQAADVFQHYGVRSGPRPELLPVACLDGINLVPRALQFVPARVQELSFSRNAAALVRRRFAHALAFSREIEAARFLCRGGHGRVCLELHRVPAGKIRRRWLREVCERAEGVVAISRGVREDLEELGIAAERILVEHDAFEPAPFEAVGSRASARERLGLTPGQPIVVYAGGLLPWKGADLVVEAASALPEVQFVIAGGMEADIARLRECAAAASNVQILGFRPPASVPLLLAAADVGVVPNRSQPPISARYTSPLKVFEAMAAGLPLVASDLPSLREVLSEEQALFVAPDDPAALAEGLRALLDDPERRELMSRSLRSRAGEHTWDARARRILAWIGTSGR
jgi:glycosyltransferase involved in cell wall biosynthesis